MKIADMGNVHLYDYQNVSKFKFEIFKQHHFDALQVGNGDWSIKFKFLSICDTDLICQNDF